MTELLFIIFLVLVAMAFGFLWADRIFHFFYQRSLGSREEIRQKLKDMFVDVEEKQLTWFLIASGAVPGLILFLLFWPSFVVGLIFGFGAAFGGWMLPKILVESLYQRRMNKMVDQLVDGLTIMANGIQAGLGVQQAMDRVAINMGNPISQEFGLVLQRIQVGNSLEDALNTLAARIPAPEVQMFVTAINILNETGKGLAPTFTTIMETIRERQKVQRKIEALTSQGMMQGIIITLVPFVIIVLLLFLDPDFIKPLFSTTWGLVMLMVVLGLQITGGVVIRKIVKIKV